ncbi:MAG: hypothetical protein IKX51_04850 [Bacteroidales bacterium]|nr:hypothetical protein [Bacteroidales bacterium]
MGWFSKTEEHNTKEDFYDDIKVSISYEGEKVGGSHDHVENDHRHHTDYVNGVGHNSYDYTTNPANRYDEHYTPHTEE